MTFGEMLARLGSYAVARGIQGVVFRWDLRGWSPTAPNAGVRWSVELEERFCGTRNAAGRGCVGQEALEETLENLGI